jgi:hypothetical protein
MLQSGFKGAVGLLLAAAVLWLSPHPARAEEKPKELLPFPLEYVWRKVYQASDGIKAMAIAENGAFGIARGQSFPASAEKLAMEACTERSKYLSLRKNSIPDCKILSMQNDWKLDQFTWDPNWQQPTTGKDRPLQKGYKYVLPGHASKGVVLLAHGCNGLGAKIFSDVWGAYFNALGFDFYAPDSFAVKRPKEVCGNLNDYPPDQVSMVWRLRVAQTQRSLAELRMTNPDKPIYMWGHSEGGLIVQMIETAVTGVMVSGEECGVLGAPPAIAINVPMLYLWGEYDQYVNGVGYRITSHSTRKCASDYATHKPSFAILEGRSHIPWPWNMEVNKAVATFVQAARPVVVTSSRANKKNFANWKRIKPDKRYRKAQAHRAAAINASGTSYMVWGLDNEEDAMQLALFGCARNTSKKTNIFKTGKHLCGVVDVNGSTPK